MFDCFYLYIQNTLLKKPFFVLTRKLQGILNHAEGKKKQLSIEFISQIIELSFSSIEYNFPSGAPIYIIFSAYTGEDVKR